MNAWQQSRNEVRTASRWPAIALALLTLLLIAPPARAMPEPPYFGPPPGFTSARTEHLRILVPEGAPMDAAAFAVAYGPYLDRAYDELTALFPTPPRTPELYVYSTETEFQEAIASIAPPASAIAVADPELGEIAVLLPRLQALSTLEAENTLRNALARVIARRAAGGNLPPGFEDGIAAYVERPVSARLARHAALLQNANRQNALLSWNALNEPVSTDADAALAAAHNYGIVAFLVERYGLGRLSTFIATLRTEPDWRTALRSVYQRAPAELEAEWRENLPQWTAAGWQINLFAAFDLQPARDLLASAHYAAAKEELGKSLRLFSELGDITRQAEVEALLRQSDVGLQVESLMSQIQVTLEAHTYDRAQELISQARAQSALLPDDQRVDDLLTIYEEMAQLGLQASAHLDQAHALAPAWVDYPEARAEALAAGITAASLGDQAVTEQARALLQELDSRQRRIVLLLVALAALTFAWLGFWRWSRGTAELEWG